MRLYKNQHLAPGLLAQAKRRKKCRVIQVMKDLGYVNRLPNFICSFFFLPIANF